MKEGVFHKIYFKQVMECYEIYESESKDGEREMLISALRGADFEQGYIYWLKKLNLRSLYGQCINFLHHQIKFTYNK